MSHVKQILLEEKKRLENLIHFYKSEIAKLPKGALLIRKIGRYRYLYLNYRLKNGPVSEYIGKDSSEKAKKMVSGVQQRKKLEGLLKSAKWNLREILRMEKRANQ